MTSILLSSLISLSWQSSTLSFLHLHDMHQQAARAATHPAPNVVATKTKLAIPLTLKSISLTDPLAMVPGGDNSPAAGSPFAFAVYPSALESKLVTLNLSATPIETVIASLSQQTGVNIVLMTKGDEKVTMSVKNMTLGDALKHLAMLANLRTLSVNNAVVMADEATLKSAYPKEFDAEYNTPKTPDTPAEPTTEKVQEEVIQRVYTLKHQGAMEIANALKEYLKGKGVDIVALPNTTIPSLTGAGGGGLNGGGGIQTSSGPASDSRQKRVLLSGGKSAVEDALNILNQMDVARKQVEITVTIHDVSNDALKDAGFTWDFGQTTISETPSGNMNFGTFKRDGLSFVNTIHALETANKAKLLASPNVSVMDGEIGSILIGEKRRFPVVNGTSANGQFIYSTEEQNVGIYLLVSTDVSEDGTVTLAVNAQVSSILGFLQINGGSYPQISTRESKSTLILKDGQTMIMGGLLRDEEIVNLQKVPLLSQIPFFGELFKSRNTQKNSSQLLISITPHIINSQ
ncbi:MAG: hypothetical protein GC165_18330 [Armatimonadetes bacterium]|nr:hypothetical protein [Armatimonadota bacterium]